MSNRSLKAVAVFATAAVALSACAGMDREAKFSSHDVAWSKKPGENTIVGTAKVASSGQARTCASLPVRLAPDSDYTRERVALLYGDTKEAFVDAKQAARAREKSGAAVTPAYEKAVKASTCDGSGRFVFKNLPDGAYYVMAPVVWRGKLGEVSEGGFFMQRITVAGGETRRITLAANTP